jgi:ElaB/YqjD/DUF883 family membrane-anchored ribosome-binding protein
MSEENHVESREEVSAACEAMRRAKAEFEKAEAYYEKIRQQAAERVQAARQMTVGDLMDGTLETVRRHPGAGLTAAALIGYFLGRLFRR